MKPKYFLAGVFLVALVIAAVLAKRHFSPPGGPAEKRDFFYARVKGAAGASVMIQEFSDFQCPACRQAQPILRKFEENYRGKIAIVFRHFPLAQHRWALVAHQAAECAGEQGNFWDYHDMLYDTQDKWSVSEDPLPVFIGYARELASSLA